MSLFQINLDGPVKTQLDNAKQVLAEARDALATASEIAEHQAEVKRLENAIKAKAARIWVANGSTANKVTLRKAV